MAESDKRNPWLIAAWPGMGNVAVIAAGYLVQQLQMKAAGELPSREHFDVTEISVKEGQVLPVRLPRGLFFKWAGTGGRELIVFLGESQPTSGIYSYAQELLEAATAMGAERVITFASMASALHPAENPKVAGIATDAEALADLRRAEVRPMDDGQISGLNGVLLAAAAERGISGICLLAEIPFFAAAVPNPKAARAALSVFSVLAGIDVSLDELNKHAAAFDTMLVEAYEKLKAQGALDQESDEEDGEDDEEGADAGDEEVPELEGPVQPDVAARQRIEQLFDEARKDPAKAMALKQELDRIGAFKEYENRFLDLFRKAG